MLYGWSLIFIAFFHPCHAATGRTTVEYLEYQTRATRGPLPEYSQLPPDAYLPQAQRRFENFNSSQYQGYREQSTVRIWSAATSLRRKGIHVHCLGVLINIRVIACPCSCVAEVGQSGALEFLAPYLEYIVIVPMKYEQFTNSERLAHSTNPKQIELHPECDASFRVDIAALYLSKPLAETRVAWLHTAETPVFRANLMELAAAENMDSGVCSALVNMETSFPKIVLDPTVIKNWLDIEEVVKDKTLIRIVGPREIKVVFRHWFMCSRMACGDKYDKTEPPWQMPTQVPPENPCLNERTGSKYCLKWEFHAPFCEALAGTPIFCNIDGVDGFVGFLTNMRYRCNNWDRSTAVMQGFDDGLDFFRRFLGIVGANQYENLIPRWMSQVRPKYEHAGITIGTTERYPDAEMHFNYIRSFEGERWRSVVNIWFLKEIPPQEAKEYNNKITRGLNYYSPYYLCRGVVISEKFISTTCHCLLYNPKLPDKQNTIFTEKDLVDATKISVAVAADDPEIDNDFKVRRPSEKAITGERVGIHPKCGANFSMDYGYVLLSKSILPEARRAWIVPDYITKTTLKARIKMLSIADAVEGRCVILSFLRGKPQTTVIRFEHFSQCFWSVCDSSSYLQNVAPDKCYNRGPGSRYCMSLPPGSEHRLCEFDDGAPIFCRSPEAMGFVGHISRAWTACKSGFSENGVMMGMDEMVAAFNESLRFGDKSKLAEDIFKSLFNQLSRAEEIATMPGLTLVLAAITIFFNGVF